MKRTELSQHQALIFLCHRSEPGFVSRFKALEKAFRPQGDAFFVFDTSESPLPDPIKSLRHFMFSKTSLGTLGYPRLHDELMPGHVHFPMLEFALKHPDYTHYWVIEYDVHLTGPWRWFFRWLGHSKADFIGTHLRRYEQQQAWYWWPSLSYLNQPVEPSACVRFFGPIYRISREAVLLVDSKLKAGWKGHQEVVIPTLIAHAGLSLQDLSSRSHFGCHTKWSWYTYKKADRAGYLLKSSMRFRPPFENAGWRPFTLYHPIKTTAHFRYQALLDRVRRKVSFLGTKLRRSKRQTQE